MAKKHNSMLIADDMEVNRAILREMFSSAYTILEAADGAEAMDYLKSDDSIVMVLLDIKMPKYDGFYVLEQMNALNMITRIPVIFITGADSIEYERHGYQLGVNDIISKPFDPIIVTQRVSNAVNLYQTKNYMEQRARQLAEKLQKTNDEMIDGFSGLVESRNKESGWHIINIKTDTKILFDEYAKTKPGEFPPEIINKIVKAAALHDIGKIRVPESVLNKPASAGRFTPEEFNIMKNHTVEGAAILNTNFHGLIDDDKEFYLYCMQIYRNHHERWDGKGYPDKLVADNIPFCAQIVSIADVYDALVSERCYKKAFAPDVALKMINNNECGVFNPELIDVLNCVAPKLEAHYATIKKTAI